MVLYDRPETPTLPSQHGAVVTKTLICLHVGQGLVCGMKRDKATWRRRAVLAAGLLTLVGWVQFAPDLLSFRSDDFVFEDIPDLAPFRWLSVDGVTTSGGAMFAGLETRAPLTAEQERLDQRVKADPCTAFYGPAQDGPVPVAVFSDFACPNCRVMETRLVELETDAPDSFRIVRHQLPILGVDSAVASRAVLAAEKQGAYDSMHARLLRSPAVTDATYVTALAGRIGLDLERFSGSAIRRDPPDASGIRVHRACFRVLWHACIRGRPNRVSWCGPDIDA